MMVVEIWSDVMCPFCYIGKRRFEEALARFPARDRVRVVWKSFQLDPDIEGGAGVSVVEYLARRKGWSLDQSRAVHDQVIRMAKTAGLDYDFDRAVVANTFDAHRLVQFAKTHGRDEDVEEGLFRAYFTEGKDIGDHEVLVGIAREAGLDAAEARSALAEGRFRAEVERDLLEARQVGVTGVPFFLFDRTHAISGAHEAETFLEILAEALPDPDAAP